MVEVLCFALHGLGQAMFAVLVAEVQLAGAVQHHQEAPQQPAVVQGLHADQALDHPQTQIRQSLRRHMAQEVGESVAVGHGLLMAPAQTIEVLQRLLAVQLEPHLPTRAQLQQEKHQPLPGHERPQIRDLLLIAGVAQRLQPNPKLGPEVGDRPGQHGPEF